MRELESIIAAAEQLPVEELPALVGRLSEASAIAKRRLLEPQPAKPAPDAERLVDAGEMARRVNVTEHWIRDRARRGMIPSIRVGHYVRFRASDVIRALAAQDSDS